ncbi:aquaporin [Rhizobium sp.]|uniref:aquaporin n=1 Tax=Rhizobium sp. TaxID=391 RepID=UPI0034C5F7C7
MPEAGISSATTCFFEEEPTIGLWRRTFVEVVGTCFLTVAMVGSGIAVADRAKEEPLVASVIVAFAIAGSLVGLIIALGKVSGGHYNPLITLSQWLSGERGVACTFAYLAGQLTGGLVGATVADVMFGTFRSGAASADNLSMALLVSEGVASAGLLTIVLGCGRSAKWETGPFAVGAWLTAAILATPSASYANPAVTFAAIYATGAVALRPHTAACFIAAQLVGMLLALAINKIAFGRPIKGTQIATTAPHSTEGGAI